MIHDLTKQLIDRLAALSGEGRVEWTTGPSQNAFAFEADGYSVVVEDIASGAMLVVCDAEGRELEALSADDLAEVRSAGGRDYETIVREMCGAARRAALGTDEAIDRILRTLGETGSSSEPVSGGGGGDVSPASTGGGAGDTERPSDRFRRRPLG